MADDANQELFDLAVRSEILLRRYSLWEARRVAKLLGATEADLIALLRKKLGSVLEQGRTKRSAKRLEALLDEVRAMRGDAWKAVTADITKGLNELAADEAAKEAKTLAAASPIVIDVISPAVATVKAAATSRPFQGRLLKEWYKSLQEADRKRITQSIRLGVVEGQSTDEIVRRIRNGRSGDLFAAKRDAAAVVRTAVSHVSNTARESVWEANADIIAGLRWTSVLDGRTSSVCRGRDGKIYPVGQGPRPPAHVGCRSVMTPVLDADELVGKRPSVMDKRSGAQREVDFRRIARQTGQPVAKVRADWAKAAVGQEPEGTTYEKFFNRQSAAFQDQVLGKQKGALYRKGGVPLDAFNDRAGKELTLGDLRARQPEAWKRAFG